MARPGAELNESPVAGRPADTYAVEACDVSDCVADAKLVDRAARQKYAAMWPPHAAPPLFVRAWKLAVLCTFGCVKLFVFTTIFCLLWCWCRACTLGCELWDASIQDVRPLAPRRRSMLRFALARGARLALFALGVLRVEVRGKEHIPRQTGVTVVANHVSIMDALYLASVFAPAFVVKAEVRCWPLVGFLATALESIFVDRTTAQGSATEKLLARQRREKAAPFFDTRNF